VRKQLHEHILAWGMMDKVPKADAVVVNPTHLAIAIQYDEESMNAPAVTAKGQSEMAQRIIELAKKNQVPVVRNVPLAHSLFAVEVGREIPEELYEAVAEILNWVYLLAQSAKSEQA
jgi:FlhB-like protein